MSSLASHLPLLVLATASLVVLPLASAGRADAPAPIATIVDVQGPVTWHAANEAAFRAAHGGERLDVGAEVATGVHGFAHLLWRNGGDFRLLPESDLVVPPEEGVRLNAGKIWAEFKHKLLVPFFFQAPSATAVVRGTVLGVEVLPRQATRVEVFEGHVEVSGLHGGAHVLLDPGQAINVSPFGQLGPVEPVRPQDHPFGRHGAGPGGHGPGFGPGPGREAGRPPGGPGGPAPLVRSGLDWLEHNRAADRLEDVRMQVRERQPGGPPHEGGQPGGPGHFPGDHRGGQYNLRPGEPDNPPRDNPQAVSPDRAFPAGRPPGDDPHDRLAPPAPLPCLPGVPVVPGGTPQVCPVPPQATPAAPPPDAGSRLR